MMTARRLLPVSLGLGLLFGAVACAHRPPPPGPDLTVTRLVTVPPGAEVHIPRLGRGGMVTPMDLSRDVRVTDTIRITKKGFVAWEGQLQNLWQVADGCYKLRLRRSADK